MTWPTSPERYSRKTVRLAYVSGDFGQTVMLSFLAGALSLHSRGRGLSVLILSLGGVVHEGSAWREEVRQGVEEFVELGAANDTAVAAAINGRRVGVAVFLDGHNSGSRLAALAHRPAPVQARHPRSAPPVHERVAALVNESLGTSKFETHEPSTRPDRHTTPCQ
jgi:predicted O-linked N-acetylglucosamine transferase (SPINDLY family)